MALTMTNLTLSPAVIGPEDVVTVSCRLNNTTGHRLTSLSVQLSMLLDGTYYPLGVTAVAAISIANGKSGDCACRFLAGTAEDSYNSTPEGRSVESAFAALRAAGSRASAALYITWRGYYGSSSWVGIGDFITDAVSGGLAIDRHCDPRVTTLGLERANPATWAADDEGTGALLTAAGALGDDTWAASTLAEFYIGRDFVPTAANYTHAVTVADPSAILNGGLSGDHAVFSGITFDAGSDYYVLMRLGDGAEWGEALALLPQAFANFHLSGTGAGVAFGKFSSSQAGPSNPAAALFECVYPATFENGIEGVNRYSAAEMDTGGRWIDGKRIYRQVLQFTVTQTGAAVTGATVQGFGGLVALRGFMVRSGSGNYIPLNFFYSTSNYCSTHVTGTGDVVVNTTVGGDFVVVVEYTK